MAHRTIVVSVALLLLTFVPATSQWLKCPTPGIPRGPDNISRQNAWQLLTSAVHEQS
jgi:hypothetical protein